MQPLGSGADDKYVILMGDQQGQSPLLTVYMPKEAFKQTPKVHVPSVEVVTALLTDLAVELLGPYEPSNTGTKVVSTSNMMYLPPQFVALALGRPSLTPRQAWELLGALIVNQPSTEMAKELAPLVNWLCVALVQDLAEAPSIRIALDPLTYLYPLSNALWDTVEACIDQDLPGLRPQQTSELGTVTAIYNLTSKIMEQGAAAATHASEASTNTPSKFFW